MDKDIYEIVLIAPILHSTTIKQVRARARAARMKFARHEKVCRVKIGDAVDVYDRIMWAEKRALGMIAERGQ